MRSFFSARPSDGKAIFTAPPFCFLHVSPNKAGREKGNKTPPERKNATAASDRRWKGSQPLGTVSLRAGPCPPRHVHRRQAVSIFPSASRRTKKGKSDYSTAGTPRHVSRSSTERVLPILATARGRRCTGKLPRFLHPPWWHSAVFAERFSYFRRNPGGPLEPRAASALCVRVIWAPSPSPSQLPLSTETPAPCCCLHTAPPPG